MYQGGSPQIHVPRFTGMVKIIVIANVLVWLSCVLVLQGMVLGNNWVFENFGLVPGAVFHDFFVWQPFTYMFLHSSNIFHILFNMLVIWMFGSELEGRWGKKFFMTYFMVCGVGAAFIYVFSLLIYGLIAGGLSPETLSTPVVGASGAVFGLILAYGIVYGERVVHFLMIFPMKARYFAALLGGIEFVTLMNSGTSNKTSNLAHLGGLISGFIFLNIYVRWQTNRKQRQTQKRTRNLKLVVNNEKDEKKEPRYWN